MGNTRTGKPYRGMLCFLLSFPFIALSQSPGGVSGSLTSWFRANNTANLVIPNTITNAVSQWNSSTGTFSVNQTTTSRQPVYTATNSGNGNFNFNPFLQFSKTASTVLYNTSGTLNLMGDNGSVFMVINTYNTIADGNPSCFTYKNSSYNPSIAYQYKPAFRIQTGDGTAGSTADYYNWANYPAGIPTYPATAGIILSSKGVDKSASDQYFNSRRNGDSITITHRYDQPYDGYSYTPSISYGFYLGSDATTTGAQNMSCGLAEVITYNTYLSNTDQNKIESYLAVKYGITLTKKQSIYNQQYTSSTGTIIWDTSTNAGYRYNITGIGRDDQSGLLQKQSRSAHLNALITLCNGNGYSSLPTANAGNTSTITSDQSFLLAADNDSALTLSACASENHVVHIARIWKVQKTGTGIDSVTIAVNTADIPAAARRLLVSANADFPGSSTFSYPLQTNGTQLLTTAYLPDKYYFTFGTDSLQVKLTITQPDCTHPLAGTIAATATGGLAPYQYKWSPTGDTTVTIDSLAAGSYTLNIIQGSCTFSTSATIQAIVLPAAPAVTSDSVCTGSTATLTVSAAQTGETYLWYTSPSGGTPVTVATPGTTYTTPALTTTTTWYVEAVSSTGCKSSTRTPVTATVLNILAAPAISVTAQTLTSVQFTWSAVTGATGYMVSVNNGPWQSPGAGAAVLTYTVSGLPAATAVTLQVIAMGSKPCQTSAAATGTGKTLSEEIFIPNVFTPNADGNNDIFKVYCNIITAMQMRIYNQWGELIFESSNTGMGWDGTYKGKQQPIGVYIYVIKLTLSNGKQVTKKGDINLIR